MRPIPLGDSALRFEFGRPDDPAAARRARRMARLLSAAPVPGLLDAVAAFSSVTAMLDPLAHPSIDALVTERMLELARSPDDPADKAHAAADPAREHRLPVCYDPDFAPDLPELAGRAGLSRQAFVDRHAAEAYTVLAVGFLPGFAYLGGLPEALAAPRRATPRPRVPAGSVAIGAAYTGVYPTASPGGWNLIGRCPLSLFDPAREPPALLGVGDVVRIAPLSRREFDRWT